MIKPKIDKSLYTPKDIIKSVEDMKPLTFPIEVFPKEIQDIITETNKTLNYPIDFTACSMLAAASVAIGNSHEVQIKNGFKQRAVLYLAVIAKRGRVKSHPVDFTFKPLTNRDSSSYKTYERELEAHKVNLGLTKKEKETQGIKDLKEPFWKSYLSDDTTPESLIEKHKFNLRGIGVKRDELAAWFNNMNRYSKGSEEQLWLSQWSGSPITVERKTSTPINIQFPFITVVGTMQTELLKTLRSDNKEVSGFIDRILFTMLDDLEKQYWNDIELNQKFIDEWDTIIDNLICMPMELNSDGQPKPQTLHFTDEAKRILFSWQKEQTDICRKQKDDALDGIEAKIESYAPRFALILELLHYACGDSNKDDISIESTKGGIKLANYFMEMGLKVRQYIDDYNPLSKLTSLETEIYNELPENFTTAEGITIAESKGMKKRTFQNFINKNGIFEKEKQGCYIKLF
jgi:hypothetical protein